jgi:hypothetical protein
MYAWGAASKECGFLFYTYICPPRDGDESGDSEPQAERNGQGVGHDWERGAFSQRARGVEVSGSQYFIRME